ncbi:MAG: DUF4444 domain-containing protein [Pseudomonadota bacterium]
MTAPLFPPLLTGEAVARDPFAAACARARQGVDAGLITYAIGDLDLSAALILAPEMPLRDAVTMLPLCGVSLQNALGALSPPELAVHLGWSGDVIVNGAICGGLRLAADITDQEVQPDWLVLGLHLPLWPDSDNPGEKPDQTALYAEGCAGLDPTVLLEAWARHTLLWINHWQQDGPAALHRDWQDLAHGLNETVTIGGRTGTFLGTDERFGMLLKTETGTDLIPLTNLLERP